jgi:hypothetical protein
MPRGRNDAVLGKSCCFLLYLLLLHILPSFLVLLLALVASWLGCWPSLHSGRYVVASATDRWRVLLAREELGICTSLANRYGGCVCFGCMRCFACVSDYLTRLKQGVKRWKKRWFELALNELVYSKNDGGKVRGSVQLGPGCLVGLSVDNDERIDPPSKAQAACMIKVRCTGKLHGLGSGTAAANELVCS